MVIIRSSLIAMKFFERYGASTDTIGVAQKQKNGNSTPGRIVRSYMVDEEHYTSLNQPGSRFSSNYYIL